MSRSQEKIERAALRTPFGWMLAEWGPKGLRCLRFARGRPKAGPIPSNGKLELLARELAQYFKTGRSIFEIELDLSAGTDFDRAVWEELRKIPAGQLRTYGEIARSIGRPRACRAVGNSCGKNPIAIIVPCHRAVGSNSLGGFAAGVAIKRKLLKLERAQRDTPGR